MDTPYHLFLSYWSRQSFVRKYGRPHGQKGRKLADFPMVKNVTQMAGKAMEGMPSPEKITYEKTENQKHQ